MGFLIGLERVWLPPATSAKIAEAAAISEEDISIKATTNEKLGFVGREEGVVAYAVCLIEKS